MIPRLKAGIYVRALIRRVELAGAAAYVVKKGGEEAGAMILTVTRPGGSSMVLAQARRGDGELIWIKPLGDSAEPERLRTWLEKQQRVDPDLWIVEIEDREGRSFVDEPVV